MKLNELFPDLPVLKLNDTEYDVKFNTRSMIQLEKDYPDSNNGDIKLTSRVQIIDALNSAFSGMKTTDLVNLLHAGLIHTKSFDKETLIDAMSTNDFPIYIDTILAAYQVSTSTPEQLEKLEVMAIASKSKKKVESEITEASTPTSESSAD